MPRKIHDSVAFRTQWPAKDILQLCLSDSMQGDCSVKEASRPAPSPLLTSCHSQSSLQKLRPARLEAWREVGVVAGSQWGVWERPGGGREARARDVDRAPQSHQGKTPLPGPRSSGAPKTPAASALTSAPPRSSRTVAPSICAPGQAPSRNPGSGSGRPPGRTPIPGGGWSQSPAHTHPLVPPPSPYGRAR